MNRLRVLAAMSGGVDSAVAAARAADAGHDVTGVHLALSSQPQSYRSGARGCCTVEDARDARRAADVIGIPFYVWDMAERFDRDVVADFVAEYAAGRTPNPCLRCNEKIKFAAVLDRAAGPRLRRGLHRPSRPAPRRPPGPQRGPGQGPVLRAGRARPRAAGPGHVPAGLLDQGRGAGGSRGPGDGGGQQAGQPRRLLHPGRGHPGVPGGPAGRRAGPHRGPGRDAGRHARRRVSASPSASARGCGSGCPPGTAGPATCWTSSR